MKETMTIHKGLIELKMLQKRIEDKIADAEFVAVNKHSNTKINGRPVAEFMKEAEDDYKSIMTLINRRNAIKHAITLSNAKTTVEIAGKTYTVAEAIDAKATGMDSLLTLAQRLSTQMELARRSADRENGQKLDERADEYIHNLYENADMKNMSEEVRRVREDFVASQTVDILDPVGAREKIKNLQELYHNFMSDVDSALSVSNALTTIEVEYETL